MRCRCPRPRAWRSSHGAATAASSRTCAAAATPSAGRQRGWRAESGTPLQWRPRTARRPRPDPMQEQILAALRRGAPDEALALARAQLDAEPETARSHRLLAMALQAGGEREAALAAVETALGIDPEDPEAHFQRAVILGSARDLATAQQALARTIELDPNQFGAYILQAQFALGRRDLDEAARLATLATRLQPGHPWIQAIEGMVALGRGQDDEALALLSKAAERATDDPQVLLPLALAYIAKGHHAFAEQALRKLVDDHGGALPWRTLLAETLARQRRPAE